MIVPSDDVYVVAWSSHRLSDVYYGKNDELEDWKGLETEAIIIPSIDACGVQWHPEIMSFGTRGFDFFHHMVEDMLIMSREDFVARYTKGGTAGYENDS